MLVIQSPAGRIDGNSDSSTIRSRPYTRSYEKKTWSKLIIKIKKAQRKNVSVKFFFMFIEQFKYPANFLFFFVVDFFPYILDISMNFTLNGQRALLLSFNVLPKNSRNALIVLGLRSKISQSCMVMFERPIKGLYLKS